MSWTESLAAELSEADRALGKLAGAGPFVPNPQMLIHPFVRNEAVVSSKIEGTRTSLGELLLAEAGTEPAVPDARKAADAREVANYVRAMDVGLEMLAKGIPLGAVFVRQLHQVLMTDVRGSDLNPGAWRDRPVFITGSDVSRARDARFVPPPVEELRGCLDSLFSFLGQPSRLPPLVRIALVHYQFETIHPFNDGNGRVGRMLISLMLCAEDLLPGPLLYLSAYFERNRRDYYDGLLRVSQTGDWQEWLIYFLRGVRVQSHDAVVRANRLIELRGKYLKACREKGWHKNAADLVDGLFTFPAVTAELGAQLLRATAPTVNKQIKKLVEVGVLREETGRQRGRAYLATEIVRTIEEPLPPEALA